MRTVRQPPKHEDFAQIDLTGGALGGLVAVPWFRLSNIKYVSQFYASPGSRLTPISLRFPCVYLAENKETAVAEIWGDRFFAQRELKSRIYSITKGEAEELQFLHSAGLPALKLCDLTDGPTRLHVGIDSATLYCTDLSIPQGWAELIALHPSDFDGILYRSRHTDGLCIVAWNRTARALEREFTFTDAGPFLESPESYIVARQVGVALSFVF